MKYNHEWIAEVDPEWGPSGNDACKYCDKMSLRHTEKPKGECPALLRAILDEVLALSKNIRDEALLEAAALCELSIEGATKHYGAAESVGASMALNKIRAAMSSDYKSDLLVSDKTEKESKR